MSDSDTLFKSCSEVLSLCQSMKDDLAALLDPETGFAPRLRQVCHAKLQEYKEDLDEQVSKEEMDLLRLEENTWSLLQALMPARKTKFTRSVTAGELLSENPYTPTSTVAQAIMNANPLLSELIVVREWLHDTASPPQNPEATTGYWKFTKHSVMQSLRSGQLNGLVKEMDPDAVNREPGASLAADDMNYEKTLVKALFGYVRAGRLDEAVELCRRAHQPWRAASIRGSLLFQWRVIAPEHPASFDDQTEGWTGNRHRRLWKSTCTRAALNPNLPEQERVLYASLAPSPQTSSILKKACRTWEDHLWAQISIICEEKESQEILRLGGSFWESGLGAVEKGVHVSTPQEEEAEAAEWQKEVTQSLESMKNVRVEDGPAANHAFHFSQLHIILNRTSSLLENFARTLQARAHTPASPEYIMLSRFFAHLCLFLRMIDMPVPPLATQAILESYLQVLEGAGQRELIALYAGALGDNAVDRYAMFLTSQGLSADLKERRSALTRARDHGLDINRVATATAERTLEKAFSILPVLKGPLPSVITFQSPATDEELLLLRSIEWTTFMETTYDDALEQANIILRYFLGSGRVHIAQELFNMLPTELALIAEPEVRSTEYLHYRQFFVIWETFERVVECQALDVPHMNKESRFAWLQDYTLLIDQAHDQITKLLTSEWLVTDVEISGGDRRRRELIRIRQIYIPELIIRLHHLLFTSRHRIPRNMKRALQLADIVADSRYKLHEDFINQDGRGLGDYLGLIRQTILGGLESGGSDPFRVVYA